MANRADSSREPTKAVGSVLVSEFTDDRDAGREGFRNRQRTGFDFARIQDNGVHFLRDEVLDLLHLPFRAPQRVIDDHFHPELSCLASIA
jgi:hypothetical protein